MSRCLSVNEVIEINEEVVRKFGGIHGLRDKGALLSALGRLESGYYADAIEEAATCLKVCRKTIRSWAEISGQRSRPLASSSC